MRRYRNVIIMAVLAVAILAGLSVGLVQAYAQEPEELPALSADELLSRVAAAVHQDLTVSGDVTIRNELLGPLGLLSAAGGGAPAALLQGGDGRLWAEDGKARFEILGELGDTAVYFQDDKITVYSSEENKLTEYTLPADADETGGPGSTVTGPPSTLAPADLQKKIAEALAQLAPLATLSTAGQEEVAGRRCYLLTLTPNSQATLFGSLRLAVDGETYLPLRLEIFGRGAAQPAFLAAFTKISYDDIDDGIFTVPAPSGAKVERKELPSLAQLLEQLGGGLDSLKEPGQPSAGAEPFRPLTLAEAEARAGVSLVALQDPTRPFQAAYVMELPDPAARNDLRDPLALLGALEGPLVVLVYGQGFDTVVLVETPLPAVQALLLQGLLSQVPFLGKTNVDGNPGFQLGTPLLSLLAWAESDVGVIAAGSLSLSELSALAAGAR